MYALVAPSPRLYEGTPALNPLGYSAAKAAMMAFTRYTASFWGEYGIRSNAILPGPFSNTEDTSENSVREGTSSSIASASERAWGGSAGHGNWPAP